MPELSRDDPEYWEERFERVRRTAPIYKSVEHMRDLLDPGWRERERMRAAPPEGLPSRRLPDDLGRVGGREYRQVNVKLGEPDFEVLKSLALRRDLAPATVARVLLRNAIRGAAEGTTEF